MKNASEGKQSWRYEVALCVVFAFSLVASAVHAYDAFTWFLEVLPAMIGVAVLAATRYRFRFTRLVYTLVLIHSLILMIGGHYTYALVPAGEWVSHALNLGRNHYDRLGHFAQGFVPAMVAREVFVRRGIVKRGWAAWLAVAVCMCISACYELVEYGVAMASKTAADAFLGGQGDPWDTQNDMLLCLVGSSVAMLVMRGWQDRQIAKMEARAAARVAQASR